MKKLYLKNPNILIEKYYEYLDLFYKTVDEDKKYALVEYLNILRDSINKMKIFPITENKEIFTKDIIDKYNSIMYSQYKKIVDDFVEEKDYNEELFDSILQDMEKIIEDKEGYYKKEPKFSCDEFYDILFDFMKSLNLENLFDEIINDNRLFSYKYRKISGVNGFTLYNPIENNSDIFMCNFKYNVKILRKLAHEIGHYYDFKSLENESANNISNYLGKSMYLETKSNIFERLMLRYLKKNNIEIESTIDNIRDYHLVYHDFLVESIIFTFFDNDLLLNNDELYINKDELINKININDNFNKEQIKYFISKIINFDLKESLVYTYGNIISSVGVDIVEKEGLDNKFLSEIDKIKFEKLDRNFLEKYNINKDSYIKSLKIELNY